MLAQSDLDAFMRQVLAKRDENWKKLQQFVVDEHEKMDLMGPATIEFHTRGSGWFRFIAVEGQMDCRYGQRDGRP